MKWKIELPAAGILMIALVVVPVHGVLAQNLSQAPPSALLDEAHLLGVGERATIELTMTIAGETGEKTRGVTAYLQEQGTGRNVFAQITSPAFLSRMKFLVVDSGRGVPQRWLATSQGVRRVAESDLQQRVFDSDFTAQDLSYFDLESSQLQELGNSEPNRRTIRIVSDDTDTPTRDVTVDTQSGLIVSVEYRSGGSVGRRYEVEATQEVQGREFPKRCTMHDLERGSHTTLVLESIDTQSAIPRRVFNRGSL